MSAPSQLEQPADIPSHHHALLHLAAVLILASIVRILCFLALHELPLFHLPEGDAEIYHTWAQRFAAGDYALGHEVLRMSPGYFFVLGSIYALLGDAPWAFRLVQGLFGLGLVALIWDGARRLYGLRWAALAGASAAVYGPLAFFESVQLADAFGAMLHGLVLWLALCMLQRHARGSGLPLRATFLLGAAYGLCSVIRPNALLLALPLGWVIARCVNYAVRPCAIRLAQFGLIAACMIAPITVRNYLAAGEPVLLTAHGGLNAYLGNGPGATGVFRVPPEIRDARGPSEQFVAFHRAAERALGQPLSARAADAYWFQQTFRAIAADPVRWSQVMLRKLKLFWNGREVWDVYHYDFYRRLDARLRGSAPFALFAGLALFGTLYVCTRGRPVERLIGYFNLAVCAGVVLVLVSARYRLALVPGALLATTAGIRGVWHMLRARERRSGTIALIVLVACVAATWPVAVKRSVDDEEFWRLGSGYAALGRVAQAESAYKRSLALNVEHDGSHRDLALLYEHTGRSAHALVHWRFLLGWAQRVGDPAALAEAREHLERLQ